MCARNETTLVHDLIYKWLSSFAHQMTSYKPDSLRRHNLLASLGPSPSVGLLNWSAKKVCVKVDEETLTLMFRTPTQSPIKVWERDYLLAVTFILMKGLCHNLVDFDTTFLTKMKTLTLPFIVSTN
jgi:hypothetical protein